MVRRYFVYGLIVLMAVCSFAQTIPADPAPAKKGSPAGAIITIGALAAAGGAAGYYFYRREMRERARADSVIAYVKNAWDNAAALYTKEMYRDALLRLRDINAIWYDYDKYISKYRHRQHISHDSISAVIASCDFLEGMIEPVKALRKCADSLPRDEYGLHQVTRQDLDARQTFLRTSIDSIMKSNPNHRSALQFIFRNITRRLHTVDSLLLSSYSEQKADFTVKNRFYYKQAIESGDSAALRQFVDNCNYYQVEKEWCQRARMALSGMSGTAEDGIFPKEKMSTADSISYAFERAISSSRIEDLEAYIQKYSTRYYRKYGNNTRLSEMTSALRILRTTVDRQVAFNKKYPRLVDENIGIVTLESKGLSTSTTEDFRTEWKNLAHEMTRLKVRAPATISLDYTRETPTIMIDAVIDPATDVGKTVINERNAYQIECLIPLAKILYRLKKGVIRQLSGGLSGMSPDDAVNYEVKKVGFAVYVVRLQKPDNGGVIMFYAKDNRGKDADTARLVEFYSFYDLRVTGQPNKRFAVYPASLPNLIPSISTDTLEQVMGKTFFGDAGSESD